jgi:hypothetical protein
MANHNRDGSRIRRITFAAPPEMIFATEALAQTEYSNISTICRRALADKLIERGYLQQAKEEA